MLNFFKGSLGLISNKTLNSATELILVLTTSKYYHFLFLQHLSETKLKEYEFFGSCESSAG